MGGGAADAAGEAGEAGEASGSGSRSGVVGRRGVCAVGARGGAWRVERGKRRPRGGLILGEHGGLCAVRLAAHGEARRFHPDRRVGLEDGL